MLMIMGQNMNSDLLPFEDQKMQWLREDVQWLRMVVFRERRCPFSLRFRSIGSSDFFEARRKVALRGEGNAWAPVSWSFDKLHEVGVLSYLFYPLFKCFVMLVLV